MAVPKKRTSISKKRIRKNIWKSKGRRAALKAFSLSQSISTRKSQSFVFEKNQLNNERLEESESV
uniref:Large ribosomal subunit protein bL32c n=3 Tax=Cucurbita TaxID=3660 RepID=A0A2H4T218_CUCMA|nr:ribosomal protein L32 [Cucurbita maxima]YP_009447584.1 ribosomal protein L32 [Cucurbita moschata]YP_009505128.1 ribosomal protein L32 [Cucurbita pepo]YP_010432752.1 ribosomal protein L32 [Cucurbita argyrosperma]YP_010432837.1 ribosomal protein L32 [Cucurbita okeechobeensis]YP_010436826.1 ribosomal protein L32 [Cucurbita pedatifolia]ATY69924.1 ribosomal protein L32 [Cucurbita maxima]ATY70005.1 ribosomal protein L32 [Cucurbita moschata]AWX90401.1 ribosomal protein L32 [Cucurbita pepo]UER9